MQYYRLYLMNAVTGHIESVEDFDAANDGVAFNQAYQYGGEQPVELWCGTRKVGRIEARDLTEEMLERRRWERALREEQELAQTA
jgi:hypothetical protein